MSSLFRGDLDARYVQKIFVSVKLNRPANVVVIGNGDPDVQFPGSFYDGRNRVVSIGVMGMKMWIDHRILLG